MAISHTNLSNQNQSKNQPQPLIAQKNNTWRDEEEEEEEEGGGVEVEQTKLTGNFPYILIHQTPTQPYHVHTKTASCVAKMPKLMA